MLFIEFFKALKKKSIFLFYFFIAFSFIQISFTLIKLEVTPILLYGMYSEKIPRQNEYRFLKIYLNDKSLFLPNNSQLGFLLSAYENYAVMKENNNTDIVQTRVENRYHFLTNSFIYPLIKNSIYNNETNMADFVKWYRNKIQEFTKMKVYTIHIYSYTCTFDHKSFTFHKQPLQLIDTF